MQNIPKPGSPFFAAYQIALDWCHDVPQGQAQDGCVVDSLGTISNRQQFVADRISFLETALLITALIAIALLLSRRLARR
ncbi:hypothetical protein EPK99_11355 [Neorhizobium lilium]|uniref:Uncharacterized protein n=1 Tax=Neorhizobium lilium TaxID=2503024 RepID=A0A3S3U0M1_9HYPH|nr:hypothetical protein [Neorhizobium lilium]RWX79155.1 hypothetical protein EPK99_11355 [Neorhizobium lilium]